MLSGVALATCGPVHARRSRLGLRPSIRFAARSRRGLAFGSLFETGMDLRGSASRIRLLLRQVEPHAGFADRGEMILCPTHQPGQGFQHRTGRAATGCTGPWAAWSEIPADPASLRSTLAGIESLPFVSFCTWVRPGAPASQRRRGGRGRPVRRQPRSEPSDRTSPHFVRHERWQGPACGLILIEEGQGSALDPLKAQP